MFSEKNEKMNKHSTNKHTYTRMMSIRVFPLDVMGWYYCSMNKIYSWLVLPIIFLYQIKIQKIHINEHVHGIRYIENDNRCDGGGDDEE